MPEFQDSPSPSPLELIGKLKVLAEKHRQGQISDEDFKKEKDILFGRNDSQNKANRINPKENLPSIQDESTSPKSLKFLLWFLAAVIFLSIFLYVFSITN